MGGRAYEGLSEALRKAWVRTRRAAAEAAKAQRISRPNASEGMG